MTPLTKLMLLAGAVLIVLGAAIAIGQRFGLGRLPGDISWEGKGFSFHFPVATSLIVSVVLTLLINLWLSRSR